MPFNSKLRPGECSMHPQLFPLNLSPVPNLLSQLAETRLRPSWGQVWTLMGSVSLEQPRAATPPTPVPTPVKGAAALAWVRGPHTTGNTLSVGNLSDLILLMSTMEPALETMAGLHRDQLQAAYLDLSQCSSRPPASSFHATRSAAAVAVRCQDPTLLPRDLQQALE